MKLFKKNTARLLTWTEPLFLFFFCAKSRSFCARYRRPKKEHVGAAIAQERHEARPRGVRIQHQGDCGRTVVRDAASWTAHCLKSCWDAAVVRCTVRAMLGKMGDSLEGSGARIEVRKWVIAFSPISVQPRHSSELWYLGSWKIS
jgi:hypothetical protein